ncbi:MAG: hypothetical protein ACPGD5_02210 [Salibacteraceae bacterium]
MKAEKLFVPIFIGAIAIISAVVFYLTSANVEGSLMDNNWCVETKRGNGTSDCKLVLSFLPENRIDITLEDQSIVSGKWNYTGDLLSITEIKEAAHFNGDYVIQFEGEGTPQISMVSSDVALMAIGM